MSTYEWALKATLHHEGGFVNHPLDPGGATNFGLSLRFLQSIGADVDLDGDVDLDDILALDESDARSFYYEHFWIPAKCDRVRSGLLAPKIFDMAVNVGPRHAWRIVQKAYNDMTVHRDIAVDGIPGPMTLSALNLAEDEDWLILDNIRKHQRNYYREIIAKNPRLQKFRTGWLRRAAY